MLTWWPRSKPRFVPFATRGKQSSYWCPSRRPGISVYQKELTSIHIFVFLENNTYICYSSIKKLWTLGLSEASMNERPAANTQAHSGSSSGCVIPACIRRLPHKCSLLSHPMINEIDRWFVSFHHSFTHSLNYEILLLLSPNSNP